jgi:hypothetical protein
LAVRPVIIILSIILGYCGNITPERFVRFMIILGVILLYSRILRWVSNNLKGYIYKYMENRGKELWLLNRWLVRIHRYKSLWSNEMGKLKILKKRKSRVMNLYNNNKYNK